MRHLRLLNSVFLLMVLLPFTVAAAPLVISDVCAAPDTAIGAIQGSGERFALGDAQTIEGIVIADFEDDGNDGTYDLRGFFVQDAGDGDTATSDGIFVLTGESHSYVAVGDRVQVTGIVGESSPRGASETRLKTDGAGIAICSTDNPLPAPVEIVLPFASAAAREQYEGMLVTFPQPLTVTEMYLLGRHGELLLSGGGRLPQPTNVALPGAPALAILEANALNQIVLDDGNVTEDPDPIMFPSPELTADNTVRGGYLVTGVTGVLTESAGRATNSGNTTIRFRVRVTEPPIFDTAPNPRPTEAPTVGDASLTVAGANVLNYFNSFTITPSGCFQGGYMSASYCRGADSQQEFERQRAKTIRAVAAIDADILGLTEVENDEGDDQAIADLVAGINELVGAETYQFLDTGRIGGDAIRNAFIYKPATVTPVGGFATLEDIYPFDTNTRPPLAQLWRENATDEQFYVVVNHLKSKSTSGCPARGDNADIGDGQGCWNDDRVLAAQETADWIADDPYFADDADVLLLGDFNAYAKEDPITLLLGEGYADTIALFVGADAYSYVFDGQWGYLDHALANESLLSQIAGVAEFHINADEPTALDYNIEYKSEGQIDSLYGDDMYRAADHDPVLVGLNLAGK